MSDTWRSLAREGAAMLAAAGVENAESDALRLLLGVTGADYTHYLLHREELCGPSDARRCRESFRRRCSGEPLQYILQSQSFLGASYAVGPGVLIPRPETEDLTELCIRLVRENGLHTVFDLCAGSGCIGISVALSCPRTEVWLIEKYDDALSYLRRNVPVSAIGRVHILQADVFCGPSAALPSPELIVSNPPYIPTGEISSLQREVLHEPFSALDGGSDGLDFYRCYARLWLPRLKTGGYAVLECGEGQAADVAGMIRDSETAIRQDSFGVSRFVLAQKSEKRKKK